MKSFNNKSLSNECRFLIFSWCQCIGFFIVATLFPFATETYAFMKGHYLENVVDGTVQGRVFEKQEGMIMVTDFRDSDFNSLLDQGTLPIVFGTFGEQNPSPKSEDGSHDCKYKKMVEIQWAILSILIGCIIGNYLGSLYGLRFRSNE